MQQRRILDEFTINRELLRGNLNTPKWWLPTVLGLLVVVLFGFTLMGIMFNKGVGVT